MDSFLVQSPDSGFNALVPDNQLDPKEAHSLSQNILYERGKLKTTFGFEKLDFSDTGLNSNEEILAVFPWNEIDKTSHLLAVTNTKIYEHDYNIGSWVDRSGQTNSSNIDKPISYVGIAHNDTTIYLEDNTTKNNAYYHVVVSDGGNSDIQRWAGKYEDKFYDVLGAGGYQSGQTTHRCWQVGIFQTRLLLINPQYYDSDAKVWVENNQRIQYPQVGKLESWTGTGSSFLDLVDTGGYNVWSAQLGEQYIIYQNNSIWGLDYVGGTDIFVPIINVPDLGLLAPKLFVSKSNIHYFVGNDYNVWAYYGGATKQRLGDKIQAFLQDELSSEYGHRSWMTFDQFNQRLWIFIVEEGSSYITKAYGMDIRTGAWMVRDFKDKFTTGGITSAALVGANTYQVGETYQNALNTVAVNAAADTTAVPGDVTIRYGDVLCENTTNQLDWSNLSSAGDGDSNIKVDFSTGGLLFCFSYANDPTKLVLSDNTTYSNQILRINCATGIVDASIGDISISDVSFSLVKNGMNYFTMTDVCSVLSVADYSVTVHLAPSDTTARAVCATDAQIPDITGDISTFVSFFDPSGETYFQTISFIQSKEQIVISDNSGFVYKFDSTITDYDGVNFVARHITPVIDMQLPDKEKRWTGMSIVGKGTGVKLRYRIGYFDTSDTGWTDYTVDLTDDYDEHTYWFNETSKRIQFEFADANGSDFELREYKVITPMQSDFR